MTVFHLGLTYTKDILLYSSNLYSVVPLEGLQERPKPSPVHDESLTDESSWYTVEEEEFIWGWNEEYVWVMKGN